MNTGEIIKKRRQELNLKLDQIALYVGVSKATVSRWESGEIVNMRRDRIAKLADILQLSPATLIGISRQVTSLKHQSNADIITTIKIPTYGKASAGNGYLNLSEEIDTFEIPSNMYKPGMFAVNVTGDSMTSSTKSIPDGTVAVADPTMCTSPDSLNGRICVFTYNDETFIKQLVINNDGVIRLRSFNSEYEDILVLKPKQLKCEGRVISTFTKQTW